MNRSKRFNEGVSENPGPGSYTLSKRKDWIKETGRSISAPTPKDKGAVSENTSQVSKIVIIWCKNLYEITGVSLITSIMKSMLHGQNKYMSGYSIRHYITICLGHGKLAPLYDMICYHSKVVLHFFQSVFSFSPSICVTILHDSSW